MSKRPINKRRVSWNESVRCYLVRGCDSSTWYSKSDFDQFKKDVRQTQERIEQQICCENVCTRGLEHLVDPLAARNKRERRINAWDVVFATQEEQWRSEARLRQGPADSAVAIAKAYSRSTLSSQKDAHRQGLEDQLEMRSFDTKTPVVMMTPFKRSREPLRLHNCHRILSHPCHRNGFMDVDPILPKTVTHAPTRARSE